MSRRKFIKIGGTVIPLAGLLPENITELFGRESPGNLNSSAHQLNRMKSRLYHSYWDRID